MLQAQISQHVILCGREILKATSNARFSESFKHMLNSYELPAQRMAQLEGFNKKQ